MFASPARQSPDPASLSRLANALSPGGSIVILEELPGGLDAAMSAIELRHPDGTRRNLVLRRYARGSQEMAAMAAVRAWRTLSALEGLHFAAPRPVWLDEAGEIFGRPALVMTRVPGRTFLAPRDLASWTAELAASLVQLHALSVEPDAFQFLPRPGESLRSLLDEHATLTAGTEAHPKGHAIVEVLRQHVDPQVELPVLVHGDFWAGNTVWAAGKVSAIVDWDAAALDRPGLDVGYCRMDLAMLMGPEAPGLFLRAYERMAGGPVYQLARWDLAAALRALPDPARWLPGYHGLGRLDVSAEDMRVRLDRFIDQALTAATRGG